MTECSKCGGDDINDVGRCRPCWAEYMRGYAKKNPDKVSYQNKQYKIRHPEKYKNSQLKIMFGITLEDYNILFEEQQGVCAVCHKPPGKKMLGVDHNHTTGEIRGLLCSNCNTALGLLKEDIEIMKQLISYTER